MDRQEIMRQLMLTSSMVSVNPGFSVEWRLIRCGSRMPRRALLECNCLPSDVITVSLQLLNYYFPVGYNRIFSPFLLSYVSNAQITLTCKGQS